MERKYNFMGEIKIKRVRPLPKKKKVLNQYDKLK